MSWYVVKLCFEISSASDAHQAEEQIRMLNADSEPSAFDKAVSLGKKQETDITHLSGQNINWKFLGIRCLYKLTQLEDETEIYSAVIEPDDIHRYKQDLKMFTEAVRHQTKKELILS